jgi:hypothetical protein
MAFCNYEDENHKGQKDLENGRGMVLALDNPVLDMLPKKNKPVVF